MTPKKPKVEWTARETRETPIDFLPKLFLDSDHAVKKEEIEKKIEKLRRIAKDWIPNDKSEEYGLANYNKAINDFEHEFSKLGIKPKGGKE